MKLETDDWRSVVAHARGLSSMLLSRSRMLGRPMRRPGRPTVVLYGHAFGGNLSAFFRYANARELPYDVLYATLDRREFDSLTIRYGSKIVDATSVAGMGRIRSAQCIVTSHGPGVLWPLHLLVPEMIFVDVWHGLGFKGNLPEDFRRDAKQMFYDAILVSSPHYRDIYIQRYGFRPEQVAVTGYARVDQFKQPEQSRARIRSMLGISADERLLLFAPTWHADATGASEIPFGLTAETFTGRLDALCEQLDARLVFRLHINSRLRVDTSRNPRLINLPQSEFADTNELLAATDLLITDWSSIACDFYALNRATVFLDVEPPANTARAGMTGIERAGQLAGTMDQLEEAIATALRTSPSIELEAAIEACYGDTLDGRSAARYDTVIRELIEGRPLPLLPEPAAPAEAPGGSLRARSPK